MASTNHKGQTAADVRAERIAAVRHMAFEILDAIERIATEKAPAMGFNWGHAGDMGHLIERLEDAHGTALQLAGTVRSELAATVQTYPVQRNGRTIRVRVPASDRG